MIETCPHGLLKIECNLCRAYSKVKPAIKIGKDMVKTDLVVPFSKLNLEGKNEKRISSPIKSAHNLDQNFQSLHKPGIFSNNSGSETKSLFEQKRALLERKLPGDSELESSSKLHDIKKKFLEQVDY
jgi:hypothetical protein